MGSQQQRAHAEMVSSNAPDQSPAPLSSAPHADSRSRLHQELSTAHSTLPKALFWQLLESTVLPQLERLPMDQQQALSDAVVNEGPAAKERRQMALRSMGGRLQQSLDDADTYRDVHDVVLRTLEELEGLTEQEMEPLKIPIMFRASTRAAILSFPSSHYNRADLPPLVLTLLALSPHPLDRSILRGIFEQEIVASVWAIILARDAEFPYVHFALGLLEGEDELLEDLPEVKLGEVGWKEKERERRKREDKVEELMEMFARTVRPKDMGGEERRVGEAEWRDLTESMDPEEPSQEDRELGNTLYGWLEVWRAWPVRKEVEKFGPRHWNLGNQGDLAWKRPVVTELCSLVSKHRRGYESRTANLRDGMWVLMLALSSEDMGLGAPRIGYYY